MDYLVLIDSNVIIGNGYKLDSKSIYEFFQKNKLVISQVTIDETIKNYDKEYSERVSTYEKALRALRDLKVNVQSEIEKNADFHEYFHTKLTDYKAHILDYKEADLEFLYKKSFDIDKPFKNKKGKESGGFRDALIWNGWLEFLRDNHSEFDHIIIMNNDSDFIDGENLQKDLVDDLEAWDIPVDKIIIMKSMKTFVEMTIEYLESEKSSDYEIDEDELDEIIGKIIDNSIIEKDLDTSILNLVEENLPESYEPELDHLERKYDIEIDTMTGNKASVYLYFSEIFLFTISYIMPKQDYILEMYKNISVMDSEWNDTHMWVVEEFNIEVGFETEINMFHETIEEYNYYVGEDPIPLYPGSHYDHDEGNDAARVVNPTDLF